MNATSRARGFPALGVALALTFASPARAGDEARAAYDRGAAAFEQKSYAAAARGFAEADRLEPNPSALESAFKAVLLADDPVLGMELVERAESRPPSPRVAPLVKQAREKFAPRAAQLSVSCPADPACVVELDGQVIDLGKRRWIRAETKWLKATFSGTRSTHQVDARPGTVVDFVVPAPPAVVEKPAEPPAAPKPTQPAPAPPADHDRGGAHPAFFIVTATVFTAALGATIASGVDTLAIHADFEAGNPALRADGQSAQDRTNILLGVTLGGALAVTLLGVFTDWDGEPEPKRDRAYRLRPTPEGLSVDF